MEIQEKIKHLIQIYQKKWSNKSQDYDIFNIDMEKIYKYNIKVNKQSKL